jgi:acid phosphatase
MIFENQQEDSILGNPNMPYLTQLAKQNAYAAQYYANFHPSLGNYFMLSTGDVVSNDLSFDGVVTADNIVREVIKAGKTWKAYEENIPSAGYLGDGPYPYEKTHDPAAYLSDVRNDPAQAANLVGFDQLQADLASGNLPNFMFIEPNQFDTMHDCPGGGINCDNDARVAGGDAWASQHVPAIINNPAFQKDGLLIITWDESWDSDEANGGGHVLTILVGPSVKQQFVSNSFYQHESVLRTICDALGIPAMGAGASAPAMAEFFSSSQQP